MLLPPVSDAITREATGIMARPQVDVPDVSFRVVDAVGVGNPFCQSWKVVVQSVNRLVRVQTPLAVQIADELLFLGIDTDDRVGRVLILGA